MSASVLRFWDTIILLGIIQGFVLFGLLMASRRQPAHRILAVLLLLITLACVNIYFIDAPWLDAHPIFMLLADCLPLLIVMPLGPLIWMYVRAHTDQAFRFTRRERRHLYPAFIDLLPYLLLLVGDIGVLTHSVTAVQRSGIGTFIDHYNVYADIPRWISTTLYCGLALRHLNRQPATAQYSHWLRQFLYLLMAFCGIWFLYLVPYIIPVTRQWLLGAVDWYPLYVPLAVLIYWLGLKGYLAGYKIPGQAAGGVTVAAAARLPEDATEKLLPRLIAAMEEGKLYLDPELSVNGLAAHAGLTPKTVSSLLNQCLGKSFSTFVNEYRLHAFHQKALEQPSANLTISGIAADCGFSSTATFQRIFKQLTGTTPSRYIQEARQAKDTPTYTFPQKSA